MSENDLYDRSQATVLALLDAITSCAQRAERAVITDEALCYAQAARALGEALASHAQWNRPDR